MLLGMSQNQGSLALGIRVFLKDQFSGPTRNMTSALKGYKQEFLSFQENLRVARNLTMGAAAGAMILVSRLSSMVSEGAQFLYIMKGVEAITEASAQHMARITDLAIRLGRETMFTPQAVASGMRFMAMAGQSAKQIVSSMPAATYLAGATMTNLGGKMGAADIMTNALKAFGKPAKQSMYMANLLTTAATSANLSLVDLGNSIRYVAATTRNLKVPLSETISGIMVLGNAGIQGSMAGTALENAYRYLANSLSQHAPAKAQRAWARLGLSRQQLMDTRGNLLPIHNILMKIKTVMAHMGSVDIQNTLRDIFGVRGQRAAATLLNNLGQLSNFQTKLIKGAESGAAFRKTQLMMETLQGAIFRFKSAWSGLAATFTQALTPALSAFLDGMAKVINVFANFFETPAGKWFGIAVTGALSLGAALTAVLAIATTLAYTFKSMMVTIQGMRGSVGYMVSGMMGGARGMEEEAAMGFGKLGLTPAPVLQERMMYNTFAKQKIKRFYDVGTNKLAKNPWQKVHIVGMAKIEREVSKSSRLLGKFGGFMGIFRKIGGFMFGPWGIALTVISTALPFLISAFSSNTQATQENTEALKKTQFKPGELDFWMYNKNKTLAEILDKMLNNTETMIGNQELTLQQAEDALQGKQFDVLLGIEGGIAPESHGHFYKP